MANFLLVFFVFLLAHVIPAAPPIRRGLIARFGLVPFVAGYSVLSLGLFVWLIRAALAAPYVPLWLPSAPLFAVTLVLMPLALVLLGAGALAPNPLSIAFVPGPLDPARPGPVAITRHPILWGLGLWGLAHVPANGHVVGLVMFGGLGFFALVGMTVIERRRRVTLGADRWQSLAAGTSFVPFVALFTGRARWPRDGRTLLGAGVGALAAGALLAGGHLWLFGKNPLAFF